MNPVIILLALFTAWTPVQTRENFGIAWYSVPKGWSIVQNSPGIILQKSDDPSCRILISPTEAVAINSEDSYRSYRQQKSTGVYNAKSYGKIMERANAYITVFYSEAAAPEATGQKSSFYSFTNGKESFTLQYLASDTRCDAIFRAFLDALEIEESVAETAVSKDSRLKRTSKPRGRPRKNPA